MAGITTSSVRVPSSNWKEPEKPIPPIVSVASETVVLMYGPVGRFSESVVSSRVISDSTAVSVVFIVTSIESVENSASGMLNSAEPLSMAAIPSLDNCISPVRFEIDATGGCPNCIKPLLTAVTSVALSSEDVRSITKSPETEWSPWPVVKSASVAEKYMCC